MKTFVYAVCLVVLSACAASQPYGALQYQAISQGDYTAAEHWANEAIQRGEQLDISWYNLGVVYQRRGRKDLAISALSMSARYGNPAAQRALVGMVAPVPSPDLVARQQSDSQAAASMLNAFNRGRFGDSVTCTSMAFDKDLIRTTCR